MGYTKYFFKAVIDGDFNGDSSRIPMETAPRMASFFLEMAQNLYEIPWKWVNIDVPCDVNRILRRFRPISGQLSAYDMF